MIRKLSAKRKQSTPSAATIPLKLGHSIPGVRDNVSHTRDASREEVTCAASEVLAAGTGICYAKSHLLAALLRAVGIPAGFCYQVYHEPLHVSDSKIALHGLVGVLSFGP